MTQASLGRIAAFIVAIFFLSMCWLKCCDALEYSWLRICTPLIVIGAIDLFYNAFIVVAAAWILCLRHVDRHDREARKGKTIRKAHL